MLRRNCNVNLDNLGLDRRDLDGEPQQARGIPRNLQLDETVAVRYGVIWQIPELVGESSAKFGISWRVAAWLRLVRRAESARFTARRRAASPSQSCGSWPPTRWPQPTRWTSWPGGRDELGLKAPARHPFGWRADRFIAANCSGRTRSRVGAPTPPGRRPPCSAAADRVDRMFRTGAAGTSRARHSRWRLGRGRRRRNARRGRRRASSARAPG